MKLHILQKRKQYLVSLCKNASEETFMAQQQDCYGMADKIDQCRNEERFLTEWLGEVQTQIDDMNKVGEFKQIHDQLRAEVYSEPQPSDTFLTGNYDDIKKASEL